jgi:hypothetical protein
VKYVFPFIFLILLINCSKEFNDPATEEVTKFAVETEGSELPYIRITSKSQILNEPKVSADMNIFINKESVLKTPNCKIPDRK